LFFLTILLLTCIEPRFLVAQHDFSSRPAILYWYDLPTMLDIANPHHHEEEEEANAPSVLEQQQQQQHQREFLLPYATQIQTEDDLRAGTTNWPVSPSADKIGNFKVSPAIHVGYAVTWYGLSIAGLYMTRILLTRGR
jgi:cytochrome oxidase assembly protein ShyY1